LQPVSERHAHLKSAADHCRQIDTLPTLSECSLRPDPGFLGSSQRMKMPLLALLLPTQNPA